MGRKSPFTVDKDNYLRSIPMYEFSLSDYRKIFPNCDRTDPQVKSRRNTLTGGVRRKTELRTYDKHIRKRYVQNKLMKWSEIKGSNVLSLLGPTYNEYVSLLQSNGIVGDKIISYENDHKIYLSQVQSISNNCIIFKYGDIMYSEPCRYADIDLKCSYKSCKDLLKRLFNKQCENFTDGVFSFSYSINWLSKGEAQFTIMQCLHDLINCFDFININDIDMDLVRKSFILPNSTKEFIDGEKYVIKYRFPVLNGYDVIAYQYTDSSPMISISIKRNNSNIITKRKVA